jgi:hypothetical protein
MAVGGDRLLYRRLPRLDDDPAQIHAVRGLHHQRAGFRRGDFALVAGVREYIGWLQLLGAAIIVGGFLMIGADASPDATPQPPGSTEILLRANPALSVYRQQGFADTAPVRR